MEDNNPDDLTGWSKLLSDVQKSTTIIKPIIKGLFGISGNASLDTLSIHNAIGKTPNVVQFFTACKNKNELVKLSKLFELSVIILNR
jgi:hypothetical protein